MNRFAVWTEGGKAEADFLPIEAMIHPDAEIAMQFWRTRSADGIRIGRDVPSRAIARLLSRAIVCEPLPDGGDYRVQLAGSTVVQRFGYDITGECISEIFDDPAEFRIRLDMLNEALKSGEPRMMRIIHHAGSVELLRQEVVVLPVTARGGKGRRALVFALYF
jgi:hypothetical protein